MTSVNFDSLPASGFVRLPQLIGERARKRKGKKRNTPVPPAPPLPISPATLWSWVASGDFPKPYKIGPRTTAWDVEEVRVWFAARKREGAT
jgi:hypothetical protein